MKSKETTAKYWWGGRRHPHVLFCKTSEGLLLHLPEAHFLEAVLQSPSAVVRFKKWSAPPIQGKRNLEKGKQKTNVVILPALKQQRNLQVETLLRLLLQKSDPTPAIRKVIFHLVRPEAETTPTSWELAKPILVWNWYQKALNMTPPDRLAQLWSHYVEYKKDPNTFVREWYAGFVRAYDMQHLGLLYKTYGSPELAQVMTEPRLHFMLRHLRGRTFGVGSMDAASVMDYQILELEIEKSEAILNLAAPKFFLRPLLDNALFYTMLYYGEERWPNVSVQKYKDMLLIDPSNQQWMREHWINTETHVWILKVLKPIQNISAKAILVIRELPHATTQLSIKDYAAMIWLTLATMSLLKRDSLEAAALAGSSEYRIYPIYSIINTVFKASMTLFQDTLKMYLLKVVKPGATMEDYETDQKGRQQNKVRIFDQWIAAATKGVSGGDGQQQPQSTEEEESSSSSPDSGSTTLDDDDGEDDDPTLLFWN